MNKDDVFAALDRLENDALASRDGYGDARKDAEIIRAALTAQPAESVGGSIKFARFGTGGLVVVDGKYEGENAVFIEQAVVAGKVGASVPSEHKLPDDSLTAGSIVLLFPTKEQAVTVTNALCGDKLVKIDELSQPKQPDVSELLGALKYAHSMMQPFCDDTIVKQAISRAEQKGGE